MKQISIFALTLMLSLSLIGCGRKEENKPTETTPVPTQEVTMPQTTPSIDPTIDTNIPDPTVDSNSNQPEDNTVDATNGSNDTTAGRSKVMTPG